MLLNLKIVLAKSSLELSLHIQGHAPQIYDTVQ